MSDTFDKIVAPPEVFSDLEQQLDAAYEASTSCKKMLSHITPEFVDKKSREFTFEDSEEIMSLRRDKFNQTAIGQDEANIQIPSRYPIMVMGIGDVHWGSLYTDVDRFRRDLDYVMETDGLYLVLMSNLIDNALPAQYPDSMLVAGLNPEEQVASMRSILKDLDSMGKILATVRSSCHEGWTWKQAGQDINRLLFEGMSFPVIENGGVINIDVGGVTYRHGLYHKVGPFESNFNKTHALKQMNRLQHQCDVMWGAHKHYAEASHDFRLSRSEMIDSVYLRTGTYKLDDRWAKDRGYGGGEPSGQSVILYPGERKMVPFLEIETAIEMYKALILSKLVEDDNPGNTTRWV